MAVQAHVGHVGSGGIQGHSAGPCLPWTITSRGASTEGYVFALNGETGEKGPEFHFKGYGPGPGQYQEAHRAAEQWALDRKTTDAWADAA